MSVYINRKESVKIILHRTVILPYLYEEAKQQWVTGRYVRK